MANINKIKVGTVTHDLRPFATCDTAATTTEKVVALDGFVLFTGATILVQFKYANSAGLPTLNVNGTGAKNIYSGPGTFPSIHYWAASNIVEFCYDGNYWRVLTTFNSDTKVSFTSTTTANDYPILFKYSTGTTTAANARFNQYVTLNPNTRTLQVGSASSSSYYGQVNAGNGFYQTSDERLKDFGEDVNIDFDALKSIPKKYFTWKDDEEKKSNIGTSAQALQKIYPELVSDSNGTLIVDYNKLSVIALKAVDELHAENQELKDRLTKLEEMVYGNRN